MYLETVVVDASDESDCAVLGGFAVGARVALLWQHNQWCKSGSKSGGHQGEARRAELRAEASRPVGPRGSGVFGNPPAREYGGAL